MKTKILLLLFCLPFLYTKAQSVDPYLISFTGNTITNGSYTLEYALGEMAIETLSGSSYYCTQGLLQPNYNLTIGIDEISRNDVNAYPNPTSELIFIKTQSSEKLKTIVYNILGGVTGVYDSNTISLMDYPKGIFFLRIYDSKNNLLKSQTIVKI